MATVTADAGADQEFAYTALPQAVTLDGTASSSTAGAITAYKWYLLSRPPGSAAALDDDTLSQPSFVADVMGTYVLFLVVTDDQANKSEENPLKAQDVAFMHAFVRTQSLDKKIPGSGQRNYAAILHALIEDLDAKAGSLTAHLDGAASKHAASEVDYERADGLRKNIGAGDDDAEAALTALDDAIAAISTLTTTDKSSVVGAVNELDGEIGDISTLTTTDKSSVVGAINELDAEQYVLTKAKVQAVLDDDASATDMGGGQLTNVAQGGAAGEVVVLDQSDALVPGELVDESQIEFAVEDGETVAQGDIVEFRDGVRIRKAGVGSRGPAGIAMGGGTGDAGGTVKVMVKLHGIHGIVVEDTKSTTFGERVIVSSTQNQIEDAGAAGTMGQTLGIALESISGDGALTCRTLLQPLGD